MIFRIEMELRRSRSVISILKVMPHVSLCKPSQDTGSQDFGAGGGCCRSRSTLSYPSTAPCTCRTGSCKRTPASRCATGVRCRCRQGRGTGPEARTAAVCSASPSWTPSSFRNSTLIVSSPIVLYSCSISLSLSSLPPDSVLKASALRSFSCFFHWLIWFGLVGTCCTVPAASGSPASLPRPLSPCTPPCICGG